MTPARDHDDLPFSPEEFQQIYSRVPRLNVELLIRTEAGLVLTKRSIEPCLGQWHIPGGTVRFAEPLTAAARRVARQELGVQVAVERLLGYIEYPRMWAGGYQGWPVGIAFAATVTAGRLRAQDQAEEIGCFHAIPPNTILDQARFLAENGLLPAARLEPGPATAS